MKYPNPYNRTWTIGLVLLALVFAATAVQAGPGEWYETAKAFLGGSAIALLLTAVLAIGVVGAFVARYTSILGAFGWLLVEIDAVASDGKVSKEELSKLKGRWNDVRAAVKKAQSDA